MRHLVLHIHIPAGHGTVDEINPGAENQTVIGQHSASRQCHRLGVAVHADSPVMHHIDPVFRRQRAIGMAEVRHLLKTADIEVREKAGVILPRRFNQHDVNLALAVLGQIPRDCGPACPATHDNHAGTALRPDHGRLQGCCCGHAGADKGSSVQCHSQFLPQAVPAHSRSAKYAAKAAISSSDNRAAIICMTVCGRICFL